jgi:hypothetical protein
MIISTTPLLICASHVPDMTESVFFVLRSQPMPLSTEDYAVYTDAVKLRGDDAKSHDDSKRLTCSRRRPRSILRSGLKTFPATRI